LKGDIENVSSGGERQSGERPNEGKLQVHRANFWPIRGDKHSAPSPYSRGAKKDSWVTRAKGSKELWLGHGGGKPSLKRDLWDP